MSTTDRSDYLIYRKAQRDYLRISRAEGISLYDDTGQRYVDGLGGSIVVSIGHGVTEVLDAIARQARAATFVPPTLFVTEAQECLAALIAAMAPGDLSKVWFVSTGSEATEAAVKLARQYHLENGRSSKHIVISRWGSYHGTTLGALGFGGHTSRRRKYLPMLVDSPHIPPAYCYRCPFGQSYPGCGLTCAHALESAIRQAGPENVAAFIAEPVVGSTLGVVPPPPEYFPIIREICDRYDVLWIADEVLTGFGRTGRNFAVEHWGAFPDIMAVGKGMASGYTPLAGIVVREPIIASLWQRGIDFASEGTYAGNPLSCATGVAVLTYLLERDLVVQARRRGEYLLERMQQLRRHPIVGDVRGLGLLAAVEFVADREDRSPFPQALAAASQVADEALKRGLIIGAGTGMVDGVLGDTIRLGPPYIVTEAEIDAIVTILDEAIGAATARLPATGPLARTL